MPARPGRNPVPSRHGGSRGMSRALSRRVFLTAGVVFPVVVLPFFAYRDKYTYQKRLREVVPGRVYRSGQMTASGLRDAVHELKIRTVVNLQEDARDPDLDLHYWTLR